MGERTLFGIRAKLLVGFVAVALFTAALGLYAMATIERLDVGEQTLYGDVFGGTHLLARWLDLVRDAKSDVSDYVLAPDPGERQQLRAQMATIDLELADLARQMDEVDVDRQDVETLAALTSAWGDYAEWRDRSIVPAVEAGDLAAAREAFRTDGAERAAALDSATHAFLDKKREVGSALEASAQAQYEDVRHIALVVASAATALALLIGFFLSRSIAQAAGQVARAAKGLAEGDLDQDIELRSGDELGQMAGAVREMISYQKAMAQVARAMAGGDLTQDVQPKGPNDVLGTAFQRMVANLRVLVGELEERNATLGAQAQLLDLAHDAIIVRDLKTNAIQFWNRGAEELYGWSRDEALGQVGHTLLGTRFPGPPEDIDAELVRTDAWSGELVQTRRDGAHLVVASRQAVQRTQDGRPIAALEINTDITDRKRTEAEQLRLLRQAEAAETQFRALLESAPYAVVITDAAGRIALVNRQVEVLFGYAREELVGQSVEILVPAHLREAHAAHRTAYSAQPRMRPMGAGQELNARRKDGSQFPTEISLSPLELDGQLLVTAAIRDVTERKQSEEAVLRTAAELARSNAELEQFAYTVSHDLKAPLVSIHGFTQQLVDGYADQLDATGQRYLARIAANAARLSELIDDVLAFSRIGRGNMPPAPVDLAKVVRGAIDPFQELIARSGAMVRVRLPLPVVQASQPLLDQIISNLLANALTYGGRPGEAPEVEIGCDDLGERWRLFVRDQGPGIPPEQQEQIFGLFERLAAGKAVNPQGTGLGLSIVRKAAHGLGGTAGVVSDPGAGACFWVELPKTPPRPTPFNQPERVEDAA